MSHEAGLESIQSIHWPKVRDFLRKVRGMDRPSQQAEFEREYASLADNEHKALLSERFESVYGEAFDGEHTPTDGELQSEADLDRAEHRTRHSNTALKTVWKTSDGKYILEEWKNGKQQPDVELQHGRETYVDLRSKFYKDRKDLHGKWYWDANKGDFVRDLKVMVEQQGQTPPRQPAAPVLTSSTLEQEELNRAHAERDNALAEVKRHSERMKELEKQLAEAKKTPGTADDTVAQKALDAEKVKLVAAEAELTRLRAAPKTWTGSTLEEWTDGPKIEGSKYERRRAAFRARSENHSSEATKLNRAKALQQISESEAKKPFFWKVATGALAGIALSSVASPITGLLGISWLSAFAWRGVASFATAFAVGKMVATRMEKRNVKSPATWGLASGIAAGLGSFFGGQLLAGWLATSNGTFSDTPIPKTESLPPVDTTPRTPTFPSRKTGLSNGIFDA